MESFDQKVVSNFYLFTDNFFPLNIKQAKQIKINSISMYVYISNFKF